MGIKESRRISYYGNRPFPEKNILNWFKVPIKDMNTNFSGAHSNHQIFVHWFETNCDGYYQFPNGHSYLLSNEEDAVKYLMCYGS